MRARKALIDSASVSASASVRAKPLIEMNEALAAKIEASQTVTPNRRIARAVEEAYGHWQLARGMRAWARPDVTTLSAYALREGESLLARMRPTSRILSPAMQRALFLSLAPAQLEGSENWYADIARAWRLQHQFRLTSDEAAHLETSNTLVFREWAQSVQTVLQAESLVTEAEITDALLAALSQGDWHPHKPLIAWGFGDAHRPSPVEADLIAQLSKLRQLTKFSVLSHETASSTPRLVEFEQLEDELRTIALWARQCLEAAKTPVAIGIAFPNLGARRFQVERHLSNMLYPERTPAPDDGRLFDIAGGAPLHTFAVCHHALLFLRWLVVGVRPHEADSLLDSPFLDFSKATRLGARAKRKRPVSAWLATFQRILQLVSWPTGAQFDSVTFQHASALGVLAAELARAASFMPDANAEEVLQRLERAARERYHEVQRSGAPIRVLDIEDASEFRFSHLWIAGMRGADWPAPSAANPFLPRSSQRAAGVPGVTPDSRLRLARHIMAKLEDCAPSIVFSYAQFDGDEHHGASALLPDAIRTTPEFFLDKRHRERTEYAHPYMAAEAATLVATDDHQAPPCEAGEREATAALVRDQSNCAFRAFARHRLGIEEVIEASELPDARVIGSAMHLALELAYRDLPDQLALARQPDLDGIAKAAATQAIDAIMPCVPARLRSGHIAAVSEIVRAWFAADLKRPPYAELQTELEVAVTLEGMALRLKVDRLDQDIETGRWVITDYKTSPPALTKLSANAKLHEPQLPLYAEALREARGIEILSLAFGETSSAEQAGYRHCSTDARLVPRQIERHAHDQILSESGGQVRALLRDFLSGAASVTPRSDACKNCHVRPLCRIGQGASQ